MRENEFYSYIVNLKLRSSMMQKNKYGQYFTTKVIADFMTSLITHKKASKILEPACGVPPKLNLENFNKANKGFRQVGWLAQ